MGFHAIPARGADAARASAAPSADHGSSSAQAPGAIVPGERLSQWLLRQPDGQQLANPGLAWQVREEELPQLHLKNTLLVQLEAWVRDAAHAHQRLEGTKLLAWLRALPVTGRVGLQATDPRWLEVNPRHDPILEAGQRLVPSPWPLQTVALLRPDGELCQVRHEPGRNVLDYLAACGLPADAADWAWLAQPDGRTFQMEVAAWNAGPVQEPAPGAWLWAPPRSARTLDAISEGIIKFLATQGPSPQLAPATESSATRPAPAMGESPSAISSAGAPAPAATAPVALPAKAAAQPRPFEIGANDWGEPGLLQTPSARMASAGHMRVTLSNVYPYTRGTVFFQPLDWLEGGFRYTSVSNVAYAASVTGQSTKDKSIDLRLRLLRETAHVPQVVLGFRDLGGTGLFSSEYLVASKRWRDLDFSLGLGWGNIANGSSIGNPLRILGDRFRVRPTADGAGTVNFSSMFRGPVGVFGGVQWRTPWDPLTLKIEYDSNDYQSEPLGNQLRHRSPINVGLSYRLAQGVTLSAGVERGNRVMLGLSVASDLAQASAPKVLDEPAPTVNVHAPLRPAGWAQTAENIETQTQWVVTHIAPDGEGLHVWVTDAQAAYVKERTQRAVAVLHAAAPASIQRFVLHFSQRGMGVSTQVIDRAVWVKQQVLPQLPRQARVEPVTHYPAAAKESAAGRISAGQIPPAAPAAAAPAGGQPQGEAVEGPWTAPSDRFSWSIAPSFQPIIGGPDAFLIYQLGLAASAEYRFTERTWLSGTVNWRLADNYSKFSYTAPSNLPRVRTFQREYAISSRVTLPNLQLTHVGQWAPGHYYSVYGGMLESMFAGVGGEWLYRPWHSRVAFGVDVNRVRQRGFKQDFSLRDYEITTGHATLYWDTGWKGVMARVSVGQYLAGDRGATIDVSRRFDNGLVIGAYATKTNVSSEQFGEGGFDKGIYLNIPLDALLPRSTKGNFGFVWNPLTRDGGARLIRAQPLYELTSGTDPRAPHIGPPVSKTPGNGDNLLDFENRR
ncbi:YjbH domain-containing protein [Xenophilus arseniciresistens]|uniref:YjbH domain-containing protein n=1 Tax=Xenophilus arseniciresistens TaxID=1283306 RepID=A0AAE3N6L3_9BURK|nr:YjbH domain-containing protein [Xenophilus arseniciresistens]MDA7415479.1 YjbH domain-containing protein [Xenophilus arseniciresistens]